MEEALEKLDIRKKRLKRLISEDQIRVFLEDTKCWLYAGDVNYLAQKNLGSEANWNNEEESSQETLVDEPLPGEVEATASLQSGCTSRLLLVLVAIISGTLGMLLAIS